MKKFLALTAVLAFSLNAAAANNRNDGSDFDKDVDQVKDLGKTVEKSYEKVPNPVRPFAGLFTLPGGRTVYAIGEAVSIIGNEGIQAAIQNVVSTGQCLQETSKLGHDTACIVQLPGKLSVTIVNVVGYSAANAINWVGGIATTPFEMAALGTRDLSNWLKDQGVPLAPGVLRVASVVFEKGAGVISVTVSTFAQGTMDLTNGVGGVITEAFNVPAHLLRGEPRQAGRAAVIGVGRGLCTVVDLGVVLPLRLITGIVGVITNHPTEVQGCNQSFDADAEAIRNGTYQPKEQDPLIDLYQGA